MLRSDVSIVTGKELDIRSESKKNSRNNVVIGTLGTSRTVDYLIKEGLVNADSICDAWEAFSLQIIEWEDTPTLVIVTVFWSYPA